VSRLLPYKRVDVAVHAALRCGLRVVVVGAGPVMAQLQKFDRSRVELRGSVDDAELASLLRGCIAVLQAGVEDFGLMPLEANAAGRPVIAWARGGAIETVVDGVTGILVEDGTVEDFVTAIERVQRMTWRPDLLRRHADWFAEARFFATLDRALAGVTARVAVAGAPAPRSVVRVPLRACPALQLASPVDAAV